MEYLLDAWPNIIGPLKKTQIQLVLDFDGTLAPITGTPTKTVLPGKTRSILRKLKTKSWCTIAVMSGRPLRDLKGKVRIEGLIYGGNHGFQIEGPGIDFYAPVPAEADLALSAIKATLHVLPSTVEGVVMEDKGASLSIHFRNASEIDECQVNEAVTLAVRPFLGCVRMRTGKKVFEIMPRSWDKGKALQWLIRTVAPQTDVATILFYIGDDSADEDAFRALGDRGITVVVGQNPASSARYYLKNPEEVCRFLNKVLHSRDEESALLP